MSSQIYPSSVYRPPLPFPASHAAPTPSTSPSSASTSSLSSLYMPQFNALGQYVPCTTSHTPGTLSPMYTRPTGTPLSTPPIPAYAPINSTLSGPAVRSGLKRPHHLHHHQVESAPLNPIDETTDEMTDGSTVESDVDEVDDNQVGTARTSSLAMLSSGIRSAAASSATDTRSRHPKKKRRIVESFAGLSLDPITSASRSAAGLAAAAHSATGPWSEPARVRGDGTQPLPQVPVTNFGQQFSTVPPPSTAFSPPTPDIEDLPMGTGPSSFDLDEHRIYVTSLDSPPPSPTLSPLTKTETDLMTNLTIPTTMLKHLPPPLPLDVIKSLEASEKGSEKGAAQALVLYQPLKWTPQEREQELEEFRREQARQERHDDDDDDPVDLEPVEVPEGVEGNGMEID